MPSVALDPLDRPLPLLSTNEASDFSRNFRELQKHAKGPYSLTKVIRSFCSTPPKLDGFEMEVEQELQALDRARNTVGRLVPVEALRISRRAPWTILGNTGNTSPTPVPIHLHIQVAYQRQPTYPCWGKRDFVDPATWDTSQGFSPIQQQQTATQKYA